MREGKGFPSFVVVGRTAAFLPPVVSTDRGSFALQMGAGRARGKDCYQRFVCLTNPGEPSSQGEISARDCSWKDIAAISV